MSYKRPGQDSSASEGQVDLKAGGLGWRRRKWDVTGVEENRDW